MPEDHVEKLAPGRETLVNIGLSVALVLLTSAIVLMAYNAIVHTGEFVYAGNLFTLLPIALCVSAVPFFFLVAKLSDGHQGTVWQKRAVLLILSLFAAFILSMFLPGILHLWSKGAIRRHLREMDLYASVAAWSETGGEQPEDNIHLADLSPSRSAVIVDGASFTSPGVGMRVSEYFDLLPNGARAFGPRDLRYVVILEEVRAGETLSAKWEAYYTRGLEVSKTAPVRYVHIDWHVTLVDLVSERVLARAILSAEPPSDSSQPLDSKVEIRPSEDALEEWLGFQ
jgi:hypothetical protein